MRASFLLFLLLLTAHPALADHDGDASDSWPTATDAGAGTHAGTLDGSDLADWHRVTPPSGYAVRADVEGSRADNLTFHVRTDAGAFRGFAAITRSPGSDPSFVNHTWTGTESIPLRIGVVAPANASSAASYTLTFSFVRLPDHAVRALRVSNVAALQTDGGPVHTGTLRRIEVDVASEGATPSWARLTVTATTPTDGRWTQIHSSALDVTRADAHTVAFTWDARIHAGDVLLTATVSTPHDADPSDDARSVRHYVLVGGTGHGASAPLPYDPLCLAPPTACFGASAAPAAAHANVTTRDAALTTNATLDHGEASSSARFATPLAHASVTARRGAFGGAQDACVTGAAGTRCLP